jgi:hypothetical protein
MAFYYDKTMNNLTASVSLSSSNNRLDLGRSIRDSIFYFDDLMGETLPMTNDKTINSNDQSQPELIMATLFDEAMFDHQVNLENKDREVRIQQLLRSIESFQSDTVDSE